MNLEKKWQALSADEVLTILRTSSHGLSNEEVKKRQAEFGPNELPEQKSDSYLIIFLRQFTSPLIYILLVAALVMIVLSEYIDAGVIFFVLILNALIGASQEGKAQNTLRALRKLSGLEATVVRAGQEDLIPARDLVPGDIIVINDGDQVPADSRLIQSVNLLINESALSGESVPVDKNSGVLADSILSLGDQTNRLFKGTYAVRGHGRAVVTATGLATEMGKISHELARLDSDMPLKAHINKLTRIIMLAVIVAVTTMFIIGFYSGRPLAEMFLVSVALAVSVIPEGLPIVITLVLAGGVWRMSKKKALVKKLQAVEALGQATVIAVDKTGTITKNELMVSRIFIGAIEYEVTGDGYNRSGEIKQSGQIINPLGHDDVILLARIATYCAGARTTYVEDRGAWKVIGDPTEAALLVFGEKVGFMKDEVEIEEPVMMEIPFDAANKYHGLIHKTNEGNFLSITGAPEAVLPLATKVWYGGRVVPLTDSFRNQLEEEVVRLSARGLRILAAAYNEKAPPTVAADTLPELVFAGFYGMSDVVRSEAPAAVAAARAAGMAVVMITGDHRVTAQAIAASVGIFRSGDKVIEGRELEGKSDKEMAKLIDKVTVFARVSPQHKLHIVKAFQARGDIVAMTGDGVNDALPLAAADLGVAMGKIGTEVAKEASDLVLLDDNFGSITAAVQEGRHIYRVIKRVVLYLLSTGVGEMLTIAGALLLGWPLPLLATQIIWLNFVTDGFLVVPFAMEPRDENNSLQSFTKKDASLIDPLNFFRLILLGGTMAVGALLIFGAFVPPEVVATGGEAESATMVKAWTVALTTLAVFQWFNVWNCRSRRRSIFAINPLSNIYLVVATFLVIGLQLAIIYIPFLQNIFNTTALSLAEWLLIISVAFSIIIVEEVRKFIFRLYFNLRQERIPSLETSRI